MRHGEQIITAGACVNADILFGQADAVTPIAGTETRLLTLTRARLTELVDRYPRLGIKLYQNLAANRNA